MGSIFLAIGNSYVTENFYVSAMPPSDRSAVGKAYLRYPDGSGVNTAVALAKLGVRACLCTKTGDDNFGQVIREYTRLSGVFSDYSSRSTSTQTGVSAVICENLGVKRRIVLEGANKTLGESDIEYAFKSNPDYVIINGDITETAIVEASFRAKENKAKTLLNLFGEFSLDVSLETLCPVELLIIDSLNAKRRTSMTPSPSDAKLNMGICSMLAQQISANYYILRCPDNSCFIYNGTYYQIVPSLDNDSAVDKTGSDELFAAAFLLMYLLKNKVKDACEFALIAEMMSSKRPGGTSSYPTIQEIRQFIEKNQIGKGLFD